MEFKFVNFIYDFFVLHRNLNLRFLENCVIHCVYLQEKS